jgi:hypothetical protein
MLEAALSTSPDVTRLLVGAPRAPPEACVESSPAIAELPSWALCIAISHDRGDESFADDLNMGRGIVSGRVALLLRSTEIRPHRPNDLLPFFLPHKSRVNQGTSLPSFLPTLGKNFGKKILQHSKCLPTCRNSYWDSRGAGTCRVPGLAEYRDSQRAGTGHSGT